VSFFGSGQNYHNQDGINRFNHYSAGIEVRPSAAGHFFVGIQHALE